MAFLMNADCAAIVGLSSLFFVSMSALIYFSFDLYDAWERQNCG